MAKPITLTIKGIQLKGQQWGNPEGMPMLALHGWLDNCASFSKLAPYLKYFNLVAIDLPGHGQSGHWPDYNHYHIWAGVEDVEHIADALGWDRFHLMGHSMGAAISSLYAGTFPKRLHSLILIEALGPMAGTIEDAPQRLAESIEKMKRQKFDHRTVEDENTLIEARMQGMIKLTRPAAELIVKRAVNAVPSGHQWSHDKRLMLPSMMRMPEDLILSFLEKIEAPVCAIFAEDGMFADPKQGNTFLQPVLLHRWQAIHADKTIHWKTGGHHLHLEGDAEELADIICQFVAANV